MVLAEPIVGALMAKAKAQPGWRLTVDLEEQRVHDDEGFSTAFEVDSFRRHCLLNGLDDIGLTLQHADEIAAYEVRRPGWKRGMAAEAHG